MYYKIDKVNLESDILAYKDSFLFLMYIMLISYLFIIDHFVFFQYYGAQI